MSNIGYPIVKCYHPRHIQNKYTGQVIEVGCGVCKACLQQRASKLSFLCSMEENAHKYCMFVTLTYSDDYIPKMYPEYDEELNIVKWISYCHRLGDAGKVISVDYGDWHKTKDIRGYLSLLQYKCKLDGYLSYPSKRDIQLFLKRLRKNLSKYTDEKIRYYAVSEYGPKTFRAHYHLLLFYDKEETQKVMRKAIHKSWSFGRIDASLSRGKCNSYVARYLNSNYSIPRFLGTMSSKPFTLHSLFFAQGFYRSQKAQIYETPVDDFIRQGGELNGQYVEFMPWRSLAFTFFPKCKGFTCKSDSELWYSYNLLREVKAELPEFPSIVSYARVILDAIVNSKYTYDTYKTPYSVRLQRLIDYFAADIKVHPYVNEQLSSYYENCIARELYISKHFLNYVCDNDTCAERLRKFRLIKRFWHRYDYHLLVNMYVSQIDNKNLVSNYDYYYINKTPLSSDGYVDMSKLDKELFYKRFLLKTEENYVRSIKHKAQNDLNGFFINN